MKLTYGIKNDIKPKKYSYLDHFKILIVFIFKIKKMNYCEFYKKNGSYLCAYPNKY